jgi:hypothetical protein
MKHFNIESLTVKYSYVMAKEIAEASAEIRQRHHEQQKTDPDYWENDKRAQEADGVVPDPKTGVALPVISMRSIPVKFENGEPDIEEMNRKEAESAEADFQQEETDKASERAEVEKNGASIIDMVKAAPKVLSAMLKPADSPMALKRLEVCKGCEHWTGSKCKKCGCFTGLKVRLPNEACPIGKWGKEE